MTASKSLIEIENRQAGRSIPGWRYQLGAFLVGGAYLFGFFDGKYDFPFWWSLLWIFGSGGAYFSLLNAYRKRSIR